MPQVAPFDFGEDTYNAGDTVSLTCTVTKGDMPIEIVWLFNETPLNSGDGVLVSRSGRKISIMSIDSIQASHRGNYSCVAKNDAGEASHSALLHVNGTKHHILGYTHFNFYILKSPFSCSANYAFRFRHGTRQ